MCFGPSPTNGREKNKKNNKKKTKGKILLPTPWSDCASLQPSVKVSTHTVSSKCLAVHLRIFIHRCEYHMAPWFGLSLAFNSSVNMDFLRKPPDWDCCTYQHCGYSAFAPVSLGLALLRNDSKNRMETSRVLKWFQTRVYYTGCEVQELLEEEKKK